MFISANGNNVIIINGQIVSGSNSVQASGPSTAESRSLGRYSELSIELPVQMRYVVSCHDSFTITAPADALPHITALVENGRLALSCDCLLIVNSPIRIDATGPSLEGVRVSGSATLDMRGVSSKRIKIKVSGAAEVSGSGAVDEVELKVSGAANVNLRELKAAALRVDVSGSANVRAFATQNAEVDVSGAANVKVFGKPLKRNLDRSGAAVVAFPE